MWNYLAHTQRRSEFHSLVHLNGPSILSTLLYNWYCTHTHPIFCTLCTLANICAHTHIFCTHANIWRNIYWYKEGFYCDRYCDCDMAFLHISLWFFSLTLLSLWFHCFLSMYNNSHLFMYFSLYLSYFLCCKNRDHNNRKKSSVLNYWWNSNICRYRNSKRA